MKGKERVKDYKVDSVGSAGQALGCQYQVKKSDPQVPSLGEWY